VPDWMVHFSERNRGGSGMTFVVLVFPAFLFIVGMSIPLALGPRLARGESRSKILGRIGIRTALLLSIGILMVHETPDTAALGWSGNWWCVLMYLSAIAACSYFAPPGTQRQSSSRMWRAANYWVRLVGLAMLVFLAFAFRGANGQRIISLTPLSLHTSWYGILGLIGWAYLVTSLVYLFCGGNRTAILACMVLLMCLFVADKKAVFEGFWLNNLVGIGQTLGSLPAIAVCGLLLGSALNAADMGGLEARTKFTFWLAAGCAAAALLLDRTYGISKNNATPSWCLWACVVTAGIWYCFYLVSDVHPVKSISRPLALAGQNVLLAYLISEMLPGLLDALGLGELYSHFAANVALAIARSILCAAVVLLLSTSLNRIGLRTRL